MGLFKDFRSGGNVGWSSSSVSGRSTSTRLSTAETGFLNDCETMLVFEKLAMLFDKEVDVRSFVGEMLVEGKGDNMPVSVMSPRLFGDAFRKA